MSTNTVSTVYATGRIRSLESHLLSTDRLLRLIEAENLENALSLLRETSYGKYLAKNDRDFIFEDLVQAEWESLGFLLDHLAPGNKIIFSMRKKFDCLNIKLLFKSRRLKVTADYRKLIPAGNIKPGLLISMVNDAPEELPEDFRFLYNQITADNLNYSDIDTALDKHYFGSLLQISRSFPSALFKEYAQAQIDLSNIKLVLKLTVQDKSIVYEKQSLIPGGKINYDMLSLPAVELAARVKYTAYSHVLSAAIKTYLENSQPHIIDKFFDDYILFVVSRSKYFSFGVEPLIGFIVAKEREIAALRLVLIGKMHKISPNQIRERIRNTYV
jgi:V/A-type H+/Na+-transporting ATPase subunit C